MKKITSQKLPKRLAQYGALSVAIAGLSDANGQIVYNDIADEIVLAGGNYAVDLNGDSTGELLFQVTSFGSIAVVSPYSSFSAIPNFNLNRIVGFTSNSFAYPFNLNSSQIINSTNGVFSSAVGILNWAGCTTGFAGNQFCPPNTEGFIGLHFDVGPNTHYGWIRIQVADDGSSITIKIMPMNLLTVLLLLPETLEFWALKTTY